MPNGYQELAARFPGKRAIITGAASGLGREIAIELGRDAWSMLLIDQDDQGLNSLRRELATGQAEIELATLDVSETDLLTTVIRHYCQHHDGVDLLINAAGVGLAGFAHEATAGDLRRVFHVNVVAPAVASAAVLGFMRKAGNGHILNVASAAAYHSLPWIGGYSASKAAVVSLTENLYAESQGTGVSASVMISAFFKSSMSDYTIGGRLARERTAALMAMAKLTAKQAAVATLHGIERGGPYIFVGAQGRIIYVIKRFLPRLWLRIAHRVAKKAYAQADQLVSSGLVRLR